MQRIIRVACCFAVVVGLCVLPATGVLAHDSAQLRQTVREIVQELSLESTPQTPDQNGLRTLYDEGFYLQGTDDALRIGGWVQGDVRVYEPGQPGVTQFLIRRARLDLRGNLEHDFIYRFFGEFEGATGTSQNSANLKEGWLEYGRWPFLRLRLGQFKEPFSLEAQYASLWTDFVESPVGVANLQPAEDLGFMGFGKAFGNHVEYGVGIFNGTPTNSAETNDDKDIAGRVVAIPFAQSSNRWLKGLYVGGSATYGKQASTLDATGFVTAGGTRFFAFANPTAGNDVTFNDSRLRAGTDLEWLVGPVALKGEYLFTRLRNVTFGAAVQNQDLHGLAAQVSWLVTGEAKPRNRSVVPTRNFSPGKGWGAWEVAARYEQFRTDQALITSGAAAGTDDLWVATAGVNWWPNRHVRVMFNYVRTQFDDAFAAINLHTTEHVGLVRTQFNF